MGQQTSAPPAHPTSSPAPAGGGGVAAVSPAWSRPDDASRQAQLDAMKRRATGLLALAVVVFVAARIFEAQYPWLGWVRATAEASLVGGLAKTLEALPDEDVQALVRQVVSARLRATRVAPALGKTLAVVLAGNRQEELLKVAARFAAEAVLDNRELIRERVRAESPWWVPGVVDDEIYRRIIDAVERLLRDMGADPTHPLRAAFDDAIRDFIERLQHSPEVIARAEAMKEDWLADASVTELSARLWETIRHAIVRYATRADAAAPGPLERGLSEFGAALLANPGLLAEMDDLVIDLTASVVEKYRHEIGDLIAHTVAGWDPEATSRRFELAVGRDLQFVRINGTIVGGLVGLAIYAITRFWP